MLGRKGVIFVLEPVPGKLIRILVYVFASLQILSVYLTTIGGVFIIMCSTKVYVQLLPQLLLVNYEVFTVERILPQLTLPQRLRFIYIWVYSPAVRQQLLEV